MYYPWVLILWGFRVLRASETHSLTLPLPQNIHILAMTHHVITQTSQNSLHMILPDYITLPRIRINTKTLQQITCSSYYTIVNAMKCCSHSTSNKLWLPIVGGSGRKDQTDGPFMRATACPEGTTLPARKQRISASIRKMHHQILVKLYIE